MAAKHLAVSKSYDKGIRTMDSVEKGSLKGENCITCSSLVRDKDLGVQCELCEGWCHAKCENIGEEGFKVLQMENTHWYCTRCNKGIGKILLALNKIQIKQEKLELEQQEMRIKQGIDQTNQEKIESQLSSLKSELESQKQEMSGIREKIMNICQDVQKQNEEHNNLEAEDSLWSTIVKKHVDKKIESVSGEMHEVQKTIIEAKLQIEEEKDKEKRKSNVVIYRLGESKATSVESRKKDDTDLCLSLFNEVLEIDCTKEVINNVVRLGKKEQDQDRPLLVCFAEHTVKNAVMESLKKLSKADDRFRSISVTHDMTLKERNERKVLVTEAKNSQNQELSGEWIFRVRGNPGNMKVVKLRKRVHLASNGQASI